MRIALISNAESRLPYGQYTRPMYLADALSKDGHEVVHFCRETEASTRGSVKIIPKKHYQKKGYLLNLINGYKLLRLIRAFRPDIIYAHEENNGMVAHRYSQVWSIPWVYDAHGSITDQEISFGRDPGRNERLERTVVTNACGIIALAEDMRDLFINRFGVDPGKITMGLNGVDTSLFRPYEPPGDVLKAVKRDPDEFTIHMTSPGGFESNEIAAVYLLKEVIPRLEKRLGDFRVVLVGGGLKTKMEGQNVSYLGYVKHIPDYINAADVCLAPFPKGATCGGARTKMAEYLACGKPLVTTPTGIMGMESEKAEDYYLLGKDADQLVDMLVRVHEDPALAEQLGRSGREFAMKKYEWSMIGTAVAKVLEKTVAEFRDRGGRK